MASWHCKPQEELLSELKADPKQGLTTTEVKRRLEQYGENSLEAHESENVFIRFLKQMKDPMIIVLLAAAVVSLIASGGHDWIEAIIILVIVIVNGVIAVTQESNAEKALEALRKMSAPLAKVMRDGELQRIETNLLVPGDIILLEAGDLVPADARLLTASNLMADEASMTGESVPVQKNANAALTEETVLGDRINMVLSATVITNGRATAIVTGTGMETEMGRIAGMLMTEEEGETPLQKKLGEISKVLSFICLGVCAVMFGVGLFHGKEILEMFMNAVALAVAAIPEGLPAIVTIVLAMGVQRMVRRNAIVKKLPAVETLGCASVICSDKTGTLTQNKMTVVELFAEEKELAMTIGVLCNDTVLTFEDGAAKVSGDPTETAFVSYAILSEIDKNKLEVTTPRVEEIPFDSDRKLMSTVHDMGGGKFCVMVKGAPDVLISRCIMDEGKRAEALRQNEDMASRALRVLAVAYKDIDAVPADMSPASVEKDLVFVGLFGMIDPPRMEVKDAVAECAVAGIRPVMITGDHKLTAVAIAKELGIFRDGDAALTGEDLDFMSQEMLEQEVEKFSVYARVSPEHKMRIVKAWQKNGHIVAMTGDGVNDAPALKVADIGCAMGITGTDVAKGAADMILTDDNFATIVHAVEEGRGIYSNIKKSIHFLMSCNIGEIIALFVATVFNFPQAPLIAVQLLWLNLVTDALPALALGVEPVEENIMKKKPRAANASLFDKEFSIRLAWQGVMVGCVTLAAYMLGEFVLTDGGFHSPEADAVANTMAFATLTISQLFHAFDVRSHDYSILHIGIFSNKAMIKAFVVGMAMQIGVLTIPVFQGIFKVVPMNLTQWLCVFGLAITPLFICEIEKKLTPPEEGKAVR